MVASMRNKIAQARAAHMNSVNTLHTTSNKLSLHTCYAYEADEKEKIALW